MTAKADTPMNRNQRLAKDNATDPVLFFAALSGAFGCFSNFSHHRVVLPSPWTGRAVKYKTSEHRFQAMKATAQEDHDFIVSLPDPMGAKSAGRAIELRPDWGDDINTICWYVMLEVCLAKALQHDTVLKQLFETGDRFIYEDSPTDDIWGWRHGQDHRGKNLLGLCWMQVRDLLGAQP